MEGQLPLTPINWFLPLIWKKSSVLWCMLLTANAVLHPVEAIVISESYPIKLSSGIHVEEIKGPIFYESFVPFMYEYKVPSYSALDITLRDWRGRCVTDNYAPSYTCPVFYHFERYLEHFEQDVVSKAWFDPTTNRSTAPSPLRDLSDFCNKIQTHFKGSLTEEFAFEEYLEKMKRCLKGTERDNETMIQRKLEDYVYGIKPLFKKMNDNYENEFSNKFFGETNKKIGPAFYVNAVSTHQNGMLIAYLMEKLRWVDAISSCKNGRAPEMLLRPQNVTKNVNDLNKRLALSNQKGAIDPDQLSTIFKLPLSDCTFIDRTGTFVVRVLIPIINRHITPKLYSISTFPFILEDQMCQLDLNVGTGQLLYDLQGNSIYTSQCSQTDPLCQVTQMKGLVTDLCLRSVFLQDFTAMRGYCRGNVKCFEIPKRPELLKMPIVQQISSDAWVFVGSGISIADTVGTLKCEGTSYDVKVDLSQKLTGGLQVTLPCRCHIIYNSEILRPTSPCSEEANTFPEIRQILLPHFLRKEVLEKDKDLLNVTVDSFDLGLLHSSDDEGKRNDDKNKIPDPPTTTPSGNSGDAQKQQGDNKNESTPPTVEKLGPQLAVLWTIVILQLLLMIAVTVFGIHRYLKYKKEMTYSKERLVYNIYAPPSDPNLNESCNTPTYRVTTT